MRFSSLEIRKLESEKVSRMICRGREQRSFQSKATPGCVGAPEAVKLSLREE